MDSKALFEEFQRAAEGSPVQVEPLICVTNLLVLALDIPTESFTKVEGGLPVEAHERILVRVAGYPMRPPTPYVDHERWMEQPHVLQGERLCIYLDPATEWNPAAGFKGFLHRLWEWLDDAIANRFDPAKALFHPVGGVLHRSVGAPTIVARDPLELSTPGFSVRQITLQQTSKSRVDVLAWNQQPKTPELTPGILVVLSDGLYRGAGHHLSDLAVAIRGQDSRRQRRKLLATIAKVANVLGENDFLHVIIAVPNSHLVGEARHHLIACRMRSDDVSRAISAVQTRHKRSDPISKEEPEVEWTFVDDSRSSVSTRRDLVRPMSWYRGKSVEIWGCGALGSWVAELIARAGASRMILRDTGFVTRGLLVRQDYRESDVGNSKVEALSVRLLSISDDVEVLPIAGLAQGSLPTSGEADLIVDCTVNTSVAWALQEFRTASALSVPVVQLATDVETATLGILTICLAGTSHTTDKLDEALCRTADESPELLAFRSFWNAEGHPPLTPTIGCSVPTFNGSCADSCAVASIGVSLAALALSRGVCGGYLFAAAHTPYDVPMLTKVLSDTFAA